MSKRNPRKPNKTDDLGNSFAAALIEMFDSEIMYLAKIEFKEFDLRTPEDAVMLGLSIFLTAISVPFIFYNAIGALQFSYMRLIGSPEKVNVKAVAARMREGIESISPTYADSVTEDAMRALGKMFLMNAIIDRDALKTPGKLEEDSHFYFQMAIHYSGNPPNQESVRQDAQRFIDNATPEQLANLSPELIEFLRKGQTESPVDIEQDGTEPPFSVN